MAALPQSFDENRKNFTENDTRRPTAPCRLVRQERQFEQLQPVSPPLLHAPCRLARQERQFEQLQPVSPPLLFAPCRLVRQERQFEQLQPLVPLLLPAPCRLVRQERQFEQLQTGAPLLLPAPCRLVRQVRQFGGLQRLALHPPTNTIPQCSPSTPPLPFVPLPTTSAIPGPAGPPQACFPTYRHPHSGNHCKRPGKPTACECWNENGRPT